MPSTIANKTTNIANISLPLRDMHNMSFLMFQEMNVANAMFIADFTDNCRFFKVQLADFQNLTDTLDFIHGEWICKSQSKMLIKNYI